MNRSFPVASSILMKSEEESGNTVPEGGLFPIASSIPVKSEEETGNGGHRPDPAYIKQQDYLSCALFWIKQVVKQVIMPPNPGNSTSCALFPTKQSVKQVIFTD